MREEVSRNSGRDHGSLKTGAQFKASLDDRRQVWVKGVKLDKVTDNPSLSAGIDLLASMFDDQFVEEFKDTTTTLDPRSGARVTRAWQEPRSIEELRDRRKMIEYTSYKTAGTFGRPVDLAPLIAVGIASQTPNFVGVKSAFDACQPDFAENIRNYVEFGRANSITAAESLTGPQNDRSSPMAQAASLLRVKSVEKDGVRISGAKSVGSVAAQANEVMFTNLGYPGTPPEACIWGALPIATEGIKLVSREMLSQPEASAFDHPLTRKGEEADQLIIFDNVFLPKERIFNLGDPGLLALSGRVTTWAHWHVLTRLAVKAEIFVGTGQIVLDILGTGQIPAVQAMLAELIEYAQTLKAFVIAAETQAKELPTGIVAPDAPLLTAGRLQSIKNYPHMIHTLQEMCGQGLVMRFGREAFANPDIGHHLEELLPGRGVTGLQKEQVMNFIWDLTTSALAGRVALFENVNATPAPRLRDRLFNEYQRDHLVKRVKRLAEMEF